MHAMHAMAMMICCFMICDDVRVLLDCLVVPLFNLSTSLRTARVRVASSPNTQRTLPRKWRNTRHSGAILVSRRRQQMHQVRETRSREAKHQRGPLLCLREQPVNAENHSFLWQSASPQGSAACERPASRIS